MIGTDKINLMTDEDKFPWKITLQKFLNLQTIGSVAVIIIGLFVLLTWFASLRIQKDLDMANMKLAEYKPRLMQLESIEKASQIEKEKELQLKLYEEKRTRFPRVMEELSRIVPHAAFIETMSLTPNDVNLTGNVFRLGDAAENILSRFVLDLSNSSLFTNVQLIQALKDENYQVESFKFEISAQLNSE